MKTLESANTSIYNYEIEMLYWDKYESNLVEYVAKTTLKKKECLAFVDEIFTIRQHKSLLEKKMEAELNKYESEYKYKNKHYERAI